MNYNRLMGEINKKIKENKKPESPIEATFGWLDWYETRRALKTGKKKTFWWSK